MPYKNNNKWFNGYGELIRNPRAYFNKIRQNEANERAEERFVDSPDDEEYFEDNLGWEPEPIHDEFPFTADELFDESELYEPNDDS